MRYVLCLGLVAAVSGCPGGPPPDATPPPRGKSYDEYLAGGDKRPTRPADTDDADAMTVHLIDIGQGLSVLLEFPCGAALIDTGGEQNRAWDGVGALGLYLDQFFARRTDLDRTLDVLFITHPHLDHTRGIETVLRQYKVQNVVDNGMRNEWITFDGERVEDQGGRQQIALQAWARARPDEVGYRAIRTEDIPARGLSDGVIDPIHGCGRSTTDPQIRVLWGQVGAERDTFGENPNNHSVAVRVDYGASSVFIPGDLEEIGTSRLEKKYGSGTDILDVDIYVAGHHGSKNATTRYMMENMSPKVALVSASPYEREEDWTARKFGHPHEKAMGHMLHDRYGVAWSRPEPIDVMIGLKGAWKDERKEVFERRRISKAVYCTCWDGTVRVRANANGWLDIEAAGR